MPRSPTARCRPSGCARAAASRSATSSPSTANTARAWGFRCRPPTAQVHPQMGSYGVGVSRLMSAIIEASHDASGIVWPSVAPFAVGLINMRADDGSVTSAADELYGRFQQAGVETLYDDRDEGRGQVRDHGPDRPALRVVRRPEGPRERRRRAQAAGDRRARGADLRRRAGKAHGVNTLAGSGRRDAYPATAADHLLRDARLCCRARAGFIFLVAGISLVAVMLGVAALIIVMGVMNGFRAELFDRSSGSTATP